MSFPDPFKMTQYDDQPSYPVTVMDLQGNLIDLSGATINCTMKKPFTDTPKIDRQTAGIEIDPDQTNNKGEFQYNWQTGDTDTVGLFYISFEVNPVSGGKFTLPRPDEFPAAVVIAKGLDDQ